jgi:hypothetical protein
MSTRHYRNRKNWHIFMQQLIQDPIEAEGKGKIVL